MEGYSDSLHLSGLGSAESTARLSRPEEEITE